MFPLFGFPWIKILTVFSNCPSPIQEMPPLVRQSSRVLFILNTEAWWPSVLAATGHYFCYELFMLVNFTNQITKIFRKYSDCSGILHVSLWGTIRPNVLLHIHSILRFAVQSLSGVQLFVAPRTAESQASLSFTISWSLFKLIHSVSDTIQPSHPLSTPSPPALNLSQHKGLFPMSQLFTSGGQSIGGSISASVLPMNIQGWFPLGLTGLITLHSKGFSRVFSNTTVQKHQFFSAQPSLWFNSHIHTWLLEKS